MDTSDPNPPGPDRIRPIAERIRKARLAAELTEGEAADAAGLPVDRYRGIERSEVDIPLSVFCAIATGLGVTVSELVEGVELPPLSERPNDVGPAAS